MVRKILWLETKVGGDGFPSTAVIGPFDLVEELERVVVPKTGDRGDITRHVSIACKLTAHRKILMFYSMRGGGFCGLHAWITFHTSIECG
jgi:hypothetical protein